MIKKVTRNSTCGSLCLPPTLACVWCITSIERALQKGTNPRSIKKIIRPWSSKWANHRELKHVLSYKETRQYLGLGEETEEDYVEVKSAYNKVNHSTKESTRISDNDSIVILNVMNSPPQLTQAFITNSPSESDVSSISSTSTPTSSDDISSSEPELESDSVPDTIRGRGREANVSKIKYTNKTGLSKKNRL